MAEIRILLTGASGFVGRNLQSYAFSINGLRIKPFDRNIDGSPQRLKDVLADCDCVVHLAGKAHDVKNVSRSEEYYEANFELTKQLFDAFLVSNASSFIFFSSVKAVADKVEGKLHEEVAAHPKTHYGKSKLLAEEYILTHVLPEGKTAYILRSCMIYGPGNKGNLNLLFKFVSKGLPWPLGKFDNLRSMIDIRNVSFIVAELIMRKDIPGGIYHISDDNAISTNEIIAIIGEELGKTPRFWRIPKKIIGWIAAICDLLHLPLNSDHLQKLTENYQVSNEKIKTVIGKSLPVDVHDGIRVAIRAMMAPMPKQ